MRVSPTGKTSEGDATAGDRDSGSPAVVSHRLPRGRSSPAAARWHLRDFIERRGYTESEAVADCELMVSELVTIGVAHGYGRPRLQFQDLDGEIQVEVEGRAGFERTTDLRAEISAWSLRIVDRLANSWGVAEGSPTRIWFVKRLPQKIAPHRATS